MVSTKRKSAKYAVGNKPFIRTSAKFARSTPTTLAGAVQKWLLTDLADK